MFTQQYCQYQKLEGLFLCLHTDGVINDVR